MYDWSDEHRAIIDVMRRFVDEEIRPHLDDLEHTERQSQATWSLGYEIVDIDENSMFAGMADGSVDFVTENWPSGIVADEQAFIDGWLRANSCCLRTSSSWRRASSLMRSTAGSLRSSVCSALVLFS